MTIREGKWKCTYCDTMNRGRDLKCIGCGAVRDKDVQFIYDETAAEVTDAAQLQAAHAGAEWICETCGVSNPSIRTECSQCGAPRGGSQAREVKMVGAAPMPTMPPPTRAAFPAKAILTILGLVVVLLTGIIFYFTRTHESMLTVTGVEWQRGIEVEEYRTLTEQAWADQLPTDARVISRRREFHHNEKVQTGTRTVEKTYTERVQVGSRRVKTGTRDLGNGYFEDVYKDEPVYENRTRTRREEQPVYRDEPIYKDKVTYQVDRWVVAQTAQAQGKDNSPQWPTVNETPKLRAGKRTEKYLVSLKDEKAGKTYQHEVGSGEFPRFVPGARCRASINNLGSLKKLEPPAP
ncbi:MAG: Ran-binding zinc finger domain-containing protein [Acidobacteriota bacterium]